jgi:hypothetical protein
MGERNSRLSLLGKGRACHDPQYTQVKFSPTSFWNLAFRQLNWRVRSVFRPTASRKLSKANEVLYQHSYEVTHTSPAPQGGGNSTDNVDESFQTAVGITGDAALRLSHRFGTSALFWLNLQSAHDLRVAENEVGKVIHKLPRRMATAA